MNWIKPEFEEVTLGMEVTGYVNTDEASPVNQPDCEPPRRPTANQADTETPAGR